MADVRFTYLGGEHELGPLVCRRGGRGRVLTTRVPSWVDHPTAGAVVRREFLSDAGMEEPKS